jgi:murein DD-endopeptidase MepM/ murein hydrolase activator NlpD
MPPNYKPYIFSLILLALCSLPQVGWGANESLIQDLQNRIEDRNDKIKALEAEIAQYQKQVTTTTAQAKTLKDEIARVNKEIAQFNNEIKLTQQEIERANLGIEKVALEIRDTESQIRSDEESVRETMRQLRLGDNEQLVEIFLSKANLSEALSSDDRLVHLQQELTDHIDSLATAKNQLESRKQQAEKEKAKLAELKEQLADQKRLSDDVLQNKNGLLSQTKREEANYRKLLADKQAQRDAFAKEIFDFESQIKREVDPSSIPQSGNKLLQWPLDSVFVTQGFGKTVAAKKLYVSGSHNGIDLRASMGTAVKSAASGVVVGTGDTDPACRGASYGKWVLVKHNNGLTTVYGHLSLIKVAAGQTVGAGQLLAYSGQSGYATGPHLHLSVFASDTVTISNVPSKVCRGATLRFPVAPTSAYLDPMAYL